MHQPTEKVIHLLQAWEHRPRDKNAQKMRGPLWSRVYAGWMRFARALGRVNALILLSVVYIFVIGPAAIVLRLLGKDLLDRRAEGRGSYWYDKGPDDHSLERSQHQF